MARGDDNDLDLEPIHKGRGRAIALSLGLIVVGGGIATVVNTRFRSTRRVEGIGRTATAWAQLRQCLVGDQLRGRDRPSALLRRIEITLPRGQRDLPEDERLARWPYRCATYASVMTHALFEANSDDANHRLLATVVSRAASALDQGQLRTGHDDPSGYLDELFGAAELANLPAASAGSVPPPPTAGHPLTTPQMDALTAGAGSGTFVATDPVVSRSLQLVLGQGQRSLCVFAGNDDRATTLTHVHCASVQAAANAAHIEPVPSDDGATPMVRLAAGSTAGDVYLGEAGLTPFVRNAGSAYSARGGVFSAFIAPVAPVIAWSFTRVRGASPATTVPVTFPMPDDQRAGAPLVVGDLALVASRGIAAPSVVATGDAAVDAASTDATAPADGSAPHDVPNNGHLFVAPIAATDPPALAFSSVADVVSPERDATLSVCRHGAQIAVGVHGAWHRTSVVFLRDGHWTHAVDGLAEPGAFTCRDGEATFTWMETQPRRRVHQLRCTPDRCVASEAVPPTFDGDVLPVVTDVDGKVLLAASPGPSHGLQMVLAPIDRLAATEPVVLIDDGEHGGLEIAPTVRVFSRGPAGVVLVNALAEPYTSYAIRVDPTGAYASVHTD